MARRCRLRTGWCCRTACCSTAAGGPPDGSGCLNCVFNCLPRRHERNAGDRETGLPTALAQALIGDRVRCVMAAGWQVNNAARVFAETSSASACEQQHALRSRRAPEGSQGQSGSVGRSATPGAPTRSMATPTGSAWRRQQQRARGGASSPAERLPNWGGCASCTPMMQARICRRRARRSQRCWRGCRRGRECAEVRLRSGRCTANSSRRQAGMPARPGRAIRRRSRRKGAGQGHRGSLPTWRRELALTVLT